jgi:hypothetical protein
MQTRTAQTRVFRKGRGGSNPPWGTMERSPSPAYGASLLMTLGIASLASSNLALSAGSLLPIIRRQGRPPYGG